MTVAIHIATLENNWLAIDIDLPIVKYFTQLTENG